MGALIVTRYERHPIGWLLSLVGVTSAVSLLTEAYSIWVIDEGGPGSRSSAASSGWLSSLLGGQLAIAGLALMFLLAPDGHFLSRRWRYAAWCPVLGVLLCTAGLAQREPADVRPRRQRPTTSGSRRRCCSRLGLPADQRRAARLARVDGAAAAPEPGRAAPAGAPDRAVGGPDRVRAREPVRGADLQRRRADLGRRPCRCTSPTSCCRSCSRSPCCATGSTTSR